MKKVIGQHMRFYPLFIMLLLAACGQDGSSRGAGGETTLPVTLSFRLPEARKTSLMSKPAVSNVDALEISVRGEGMTEISQTLDVSPGEAVSRTLEIPIGFARIFSVTVFDLGGNAIYGGTSPPTDVVPGETTQVSILLRPLLLNLPSELPKFSENYLMLDVLGTSPFVAPARSANYATRAGIPALSDHYTLPNQD